jgi:hypothetical protein
VKGWRPSPAMRQAGKEHARAVAELLGEGGQALSRALLAAQQRVGVAGQFFKAEVADDRPK